jgi:protein PET100, fungi type
MKMGGPNLEIFKFALYVFTPVMTMRMFSIFFPSFTLVLAEPPPPLPSPILQLPRFPISLPLPPPSLRPPPPSLILIPLLPPNPFNPPSTHPPSLTLPLHTVYFGTNLDRRFAVPDFWPKPSETHRIPFERDEIAAEMERLKRKRLWLREQRLKNERAGEHQQQGQRERKGDRED